MFTNLHPKHNPDMLMNQFSVSILSHILIIIYVYLSLIRRRRT
jgi:hypothetical protein